MATNSVPLDTWVVVEPVTNNELKSISTHGTQQEAELERDRRNAQVGKRLYSACRILEPVAARMGCAARSVRPVSSRFAVQLCSPLTGRRVGLVTAGHLSRLTEEISVFLQCQAGHSGRGLKRLPSSSLCSSPMMDGSPPSQHVTWYMQ